MEEIEEDIEQSIQSLESLMSAEGENEPSMASTLALIQRYQALLDQRTNLMKNMGSFLQERDKYVSLLQGLQQEFNEILDKFSAMSQAMTEVQTVWFPQMTEKLEAIR